jgi:septum formation protein
VYLDGEYYHKPADRKAAINMLAALSGKTHEVYSGLTVAYKGKIYKESEKSEVIFKELTPEGIAQYVDTFLPFDKAGAYGIQDECPVAGYRGSYTNIMGLPLEKLKELLARIGVTNG